MKNKIGLEVVGTLIVPTTKEIKSQTDLIKAFEKIKKDRKYVGDLFDVDFGIYNIDNEEKKVNFGITGYVWIDSSLEEQVKENWFIEDIHEWTERTRSIIHRDFGKVNNIFFNNIIERNSVALVS